MTQKTLEPAQSTAPATNPPATHEVFKVVASTIVKDSQERAEQYLEETVVPHGGE